MTQSTIPAKATYSVIFANQRTKTDPKGYAKMADRMVELVAQQPGCLGFDSARDARGFGITVSYWESLEAIKAWRHHPEHLQAQADGRNKWYSHYDLHIAKIEHSHSFSQT